MPIILLRPFKGFLGKTHVIQVEGRHWLVVFQMYANIRFA
jgi:hypothetical protein